MNTVLAVFHLDSPDSLKRAIVTALGGLVLLFVNPLLASKGWPQVSDTGLEAFAGVVATFLLQSGANSATQKLADAKQAGSSAAAKVTTLDDAGKTLTSGAP